MAALQRGGALTRIIRCPQCRRPWLPQSRELSASARVLCQSPEKSANRHRPVLNASSESAQSSIQRRCAGIFSMRDRLSSQRSRSKGQNQGVEAKANPYVLGQSTKKPIRTRFAPSPTGYLHLGSLRTALFCQLAALASDGGSFILRLEDTDQKRRVQGAEERITTDLKWLGLEWSEGPDCGGPYGPYRQSDRMDRYREHAHKLVEEGHAYRCFCKSEDLEKQKRELHEAGKPTIYPGTCRSIPAAESAERASKESFVIRFKGDSFEDLSFKDAIYGPFKKNEKEEDFIIIKTDEHPTYHFANVVDDHLMHITHVIRGEEWLVSTPKHIALYKAFGWTPPTFAHLGLLTNDDGSKLSKRNESADVARYKEEGYSPQAMQAWLANLGSSFKPKLSSTPRTLQEVSDALSFKFTKGGIKLNPEKLDKFDVDHHQSILSRPEESWSPQDKELIDNSILKPALAEIHRLTGANQEGVFESTIQTPIWDKTTKDLVPELADENYSMDYLRRMLILTRQRYKKRGDLLRMVHAHPHYFWRVPDDLYIHALAQENDYNAITFTAFLNLVIKAYKKGQLSKNGRLWSGNASHKVLRFIKTDLHDKHPDFPVPLLYTYQRMVATGQAHVPTHSVFELFDVLGAEEWRQRAVDIREHLFDLMQEQGVAINSEL